MSTSKWLKKELRKKITIAKKLSDNLCQGGFPNKSDCSWYHGNWILLRYLDLVSNPYWHQDFYKDALTGINRDVNLLVLGTADFSTPFLCTSLGFSNITINDICETPLELCSEVSKEYNFNWEIISDNLMDQNGKETNFDLIINDAFLTRFKKDEKLSVLNRIYSLLSDEGKYITTARIGSYSRNGYQANYKDRLGFVKDAEKKNFQI